MRDRRTVPTVREPNWSAIFYVLIAILVVAAVLAVTVPTIILALIGREAGEPFGLWQAMFVVVVLLFAAYFVRAKKHDRRDSVRAGQSEQTASHRVQRRAPGLSALCIECEH